MPLKTFRRSVALCFVVALFCSASSTAAPPPGKGGGGGDDGASLPGTILFHYGGEAWGMNPDGTGKSGITGFPGGTASKLLYGSNPVWDRWWLYTKDLGQDSLGLTIRELFAGRPVVLSDGSISVLEVQVTDLHSDSIRVGHGSRHRPEWSNDGLDSFVSFKGTQLDTSGDKPQFVANHLLRLNISGSQIQAAADAGVDLKIRAGAAELEAFETTSSAYEGEFVQHHWSPDGTRALYLTYDWEQTDEDLWITDRSVDPPARWKLWESMDHYSGFGRWSPDGWTVAVHDQSEVWTVNPDGSNAARALEATSRDRFGKAFWSPDSQQLTFLVFRERANGSETYVARAPATGGSYTILTSDLDKLIHKEPLEWSTNQAP